MPVSADVHLGLRLFGRFKRKTLWQGFQRKQFTVPEQVTVFTNAKLDVLGFGDVDAA